MTQFRGKQFCRIIIFVIMTDLFKENLNLKRLFLFYILLGVTDTVHHLHAATALGQSNAIHAFWTGIVLIPIAILLVLSFLYSNNKYFLWGFFAIAGLATLFPGLYHGGWDHVMKILSFVRINGESTNIHSLFPVDNFDLWFYEITGSLEFLLAVFSTFYLYKTICKKQ